jgi:tetratricopeptide (TPR) repeat protein
MSKSSTFRYAIFAVAASIICGFFHSLPLFGIPPTQASYAAAIRGLASLRKLEGYGEASVIDLAARRLWQAGGTSMLATGQWLAVFAGWTLAALAVFAVVHAIVRLLDDKRVRGILFGSTVVLVLATSVPPLWEMFTRRSERIWDLRLLVPLELADKIRETDRERVFANPAALAQLLPLVPDFGDSVSMADSVLLSRNPSKWREDFRWMKWNAVLLSGPVGEYRPLLDHLMASPDWHLAFITNYGFLFRYGSGLPPRSLDAAFRFGSDQETAVYLAQIAGYYGAVRRSADARACIERALELAPDNTSVLSHAATFAAAQKRWQDAISYSRRALENDHGLIHAKLTQALALFETGEAEKAEELVNDVLLETPDDMYTLFLSARTRRSLNDYGGEAESLERLVAIASKTGAPTASYRVYLGQAYARQGLAEPAVRNYRAALESGQLDARQSDELRDAINAIESKTGH